MSIFLNSSQHKPFENLNSNPLLGVGNNPYRQRLRFVLRFFRGLFTRKPVNSFPSKEYLSKVLKNQVRANKIFDEAINDTYRGK